MPNRQRVLVVDDDRDILRGASIRLRAAGYDVLLAEDGRAGLDCACAAHPDAILLDMQMPKMDGMAVLSELRENPATRMIPVVMLSANAIERTRAGALDRGARYFVEKPYQAPQLIETLRAAMSPSSFAPAGWQGAIA